MLTTSTFFSSRSFLLPLCRLSVLGAITSTQQKLKLYTKVPENGLVLYCGTILTDDGKEKRVNIDFEPFRPINTSLYLCDNKFHTEVRMHAPSTMALSLPFCAYCSSSNFFLLYTLCFACTQRSP
jgi:hypothetical protein